MEKRIHEVERNTLYELATYPAVIAYYLVGGVRKNTANKLVELGYEAYQETTTSISLLVKWEYEVLEALLKVGIRL